MDVIYLDFCKAIGDLLLWIKNFLHDRQQRVIIGDSSSNWIPVTSGIPQGSLLGQILFLIYIDDLPGALDCLQMMQSYI